MEVSDMPINDKTFISLIRRIILDTNTNATNSEYNILKIACNRAKNLSRSKAKSLLDKYTGKYWNVEYLEGDNNAIYTNKLIFDFSDEYYNLEGE